MGIVDSVLIKYGAVAIGYTTTGLPVFGPGKEDYLKSINHDAAKISSDYVRNTSLLFNYSKGIGRILICCKDV